jgi:hypothetical protein
LDEAGENVVKLHRDLKELTLRAERLFDAELPLRKQHDLLHYLYKATDVIREE